MLSVEFITDHPVPSKMEQDVVYLEGESRNIDDIYFAFFLCPCGCKTLIALPVYTGEKTCRPSWLLQSIDPLTLSPSIRQLSGCKAHFFIRGGQVEWCGQRPV